MKPSLRFIHCADLHLDSPFQGFYDLPDSILTHVRESTFEAFHHVIDKAIEHKVDFVLFAGDIFDQDGRSLRAQIRFKKGLEKLNEKGIHAYVSFGNHDHLDGSFFPVTYPQNVHIFNRETVDTLPFYKGEEKVAQIHGFSYEKRAVRDSKIDEYPTPSKDVYHIGMLHGSIASNTDHDVYAPFRLEELVSKGYDYWALGHIHKKEVLHEEPHVVYSGNIQGRHRNESGDRGCYLVELKETATELTFVPTHTIRFESITINVDACESLDEVEEKVASWKEDARTSSPRTFYTLYLEGKLSNSIINKEVMNELQSIWNEQEEGETNWIWVHKLNWSQVPTWDRDQLMEGSHFVGELVRDLSSISSIQEDVRELTRHTQARKFIDSFSQDEQDEIKKQAEELLLTALMKEER